MTEQSLAEGECAKPQASLGGGQAGGGGLGGGGEGGGRPPSRRKTNWISKMLSGVI